MFTCKYCGNPSTVDPSDQVRPVDYCHPGDHGPSAIDTFIESIETDGYIAVFQSGSPMFNELMLRVVPIFEAYPKSDQALAFACLFGILIGEMEGEAVDGEKLGVIITLEDRIRIFLAQARVVAKATIADKVMGDRPVQGGVQ